eukprot:CAMPEP_0184864784 /NCGR_PEP_ID=MMETSP0580-20130426/16087_1 /TAXON_ID=1118495 /ORGANISM="Dactyliosolen fragilissimus" /LENGTH=653 /DNA_ID=CAMNT_0027363703 /DNA_START=47 /DNA_END=2008 /DNA_ORIENTATION=-
MQKDLKKQTARRLADEELIHIKEMVQRESMSRSQNSSLRKYGNSVSQDQRLQQSNQAQLSAFTNSRTSHDSLQGNVFRMKKSDAPFSISPQNVHVLHSSDRYVGSDLSSHNKQRGNAKPVHQKQSNRRDAGRKSPKAFENKLKKEYSYRTSTSPNKISNVSHSPRKEKEACDYSKTSKLPHGLTVEELKAMTRARLASEMLNNEHRDKHHHLQQPQRGLNSNLYSHSSTCKSFDSNDVRSNKQRHNVGIERNFDSIYRNRKLNNLIGVNASALPNQLKKNSTQRNGETLFRKNDHVVGKIQSQDIYRIYPSKSGPIFSSGLNGLHHSDPTETASVTSGNSSAISSETNGSDTSVPNSSVHNYGPSYCSVNRTASFPWRNVGKGIEKKPFIDKNMSHTFDLHGTNDISRVIPASPFGLADSLEVHRNSFGPRDDMCENAFESSMSTSYQVGLPSQQGSVLSSISRNGDSIQENTWHSLFANSSQTSSHPTTTTSISRNVVNDKDVSVSHLFAPNSSRHADDLYSNSDLPNSMAESVLQTSIHGSESEGLCLNSFNKNIPCKDLNAFSSVFRNSSYECSDARIPPERVLSSTSTSSAGISGKNEYLDATQNNPTSKETNSSDTVHSQLQKDLLAILTIGDNNPSLSQPSSNTRMD